MKYKLAMIFVSVLALSAFTGWLTGYNFDRRDGDIAAWFVMSIMVAVFVTAITRDVMEDQI